LVEWVGRNGKEHHHEDDRGEVICGWSAWSPLFLFEDRRNLHFIFPTLAAQLAHKYLGFRPVLIPLIQSDPEVANESLYNQMTKLIVQPLSKTNISTVVVIDAPDECEDRESALAILSVLGRLKSEDR